VVDTFSEGHYAARANDSGHFLGQYCYQSKGSCLWLLAIKTRCDEGDKYPVLINSDAGSAQVEVHCLGHLPSAGMYRYAFTDFELIDRTVRNGRRIGFAIPLESDQFRVLRFDLTGASSALNSMRARAQANSQTRPAIRNTRDQVM
jgi:hypothetical protein